MKDEIQISVFWFYWLIAVVLGIMLFGISMIIFPELIRHFFSLLIYSSAVFIEDQFRTEALSYITLVHGVLGSVMFGWGLAMLLILLGPFRRGGKEGWLILSASLAVWFFPDTIFSLYMGYWQNALLNLIIGILFAIPLIFTYNQQKTSAPN